MKNSVYFGVSCTGHDNSIALVDSQGKLLFAEAAERYFQKKRASNMAADDYFVVKMRIKGKK